MIEELNYEPELEEEVVLKSAGRPVRKITVLRRAICDVMIDPDFVDPEIEFLHFAAPPLGLAGIQTLFFSAKFIRHCEKAARNAGDRRPKATQLKYAIMGRMTGPGLQERSGHVPNWTLAATFAGHRHQQITAYRAAFPEVDWDGADIQRLGVREV